MYAVLSFAAGAVALFLPETQGRPMPDTIEDLLKTGQDAPITGKVENLSWKHVDLMQQEILAQEILAQETLHKHDNEERSLI